MNTATKTRPLTVDRPRRQRATKKANAVRPRKDRHVQKDAEKRNAFPRRPDKTTHPFETTLDF